MLDLDEARRLAESVVERGTRAGATAADALYIGERSSSVQVRLGEIEQVGQSENEEIGLRLFVGQRSATVASSDLSGEVLDLLVDRCLAMAREAPEDPFAGLAPRSLLALGDLADIEAADGRDVSPGDLHAMALEAENAGRAIQGITNSGGAGASAGRLSSALATSDGFSGASEATSYGCSAALIAGEGSSMQRDHAWHSARHFADLDHPSDIGHKAGERTVARLNPARPKPGTYPVIFDPRVSSGLLGHFAGAINGAAIARQSSFLLGKLGERVFAPGVAIIDDPLRPRGLRSRRFDAEGLRVARAEVVKDGILQCWMADSASARQLGIEPTGHAARGAGGLPNASPSNFFMASGQRSRTEMFGTLSEALLVTELIGQGVNPVTGDYSRGAAGFMVRNGEICEPVAEITIASNLIEMFATLEPAADLEFRRGIDAPTILVPEMVVAAA